MRSSLQGWLGISWVLGYPCVNLRWRERYKAKIIRYRTTGGKSHAYVVVYPLGVGRRSGVVASKLADMLAASIAALLAASFAAILAASLSAFLALAPADILAPAIAV